MSDLYSLLGEEESERRSPLGELGETRTPDEVAQEQVIANEVGQPPQAVRAYPDLFARSAEQSRTQRATESSPRLQRWLSQSNNYAVARDDVENLSQVERLGEREAAVMRFDEEARAYFEERDWLRPFRGLLAIPRGLARPVARAIDDTGDTTQYYGAGQREQELLQLERQQQRAFEGLGEPLNDAEAERLHELRRMEAPEGGVPVVREALRQIPLLQGMIGRAGGEIFSGQEPAGLIYSTPAGQRALRAGRADLRTLAEEGLGQFSFDLGGDQARTAYQVAGSVPGSGLFTYIWDMEAAGVYQAAIEQGVPREVAADAAEQAGALNAAVEVFGAGLILRSAGAGELADEALGATTARSAIRNVTLRWALERAGVRTAEAGFIGGAEEGVQETFSILAETGARRRAGVATPEDLGIAERYAEGVRAGIEGGIGLAAPVTSANLYLDLRAVRAAEANQEVFEQLALGAQNSRLRERLPSAMTAAVESMTAGTPLEVMRIDADAWVEHFQEARIDPVRAAEQVGVTREALQRALAAHGDIEVRTGAYAAHIAASPHHQALIQHARLRPTDFTQAELEAHKSNIESVAREIVDTAAETAKNENELGQAVEARMRELFSVAEQEGGPRPEIAARNARLAAGLARTISARMRAAAQRGEISQETAERYEQQLRTMFGQNLDIAGPGRGLREAGSELPQSAKDGQNGDQPLGSDNGEQAPQDFQTRLERVRARFASARAQAQDGAEAGAVGGVREDADAGAGRGAGAGTGAVRSPQGQDPADVEAALSVSGIRIVTKKPKIVGQFGDYVVTIDMADAFAPELDQALTARAGAPGRQSAFHIDYVDGSNPKDVRLPGVYLRTTSINDAVKGTGAGVWLYRQIIDWAHRKGLPAFSDFSISTEAQRIYPALERRGYRVTQINPYAVDPEDGAFVNTEFKPIFRIDQTGEETAYQAADIPEGDYQIDGPTLKERLASADQELDQGQERGAIRQPRLAALHNLTAENLLRAAELGGLAVPSVGVVSEGMGLQDIGGEITLIGNRDLADPEQEPVYNSDIWSPTFPRAEYDRVLVRTIEKSSLYKALKKWDAYYSDVGVGAGATLWENAYNNPRPDEAIRLLRNDVGAMAAWLDEIGETPVAPITREKLLKQSTPWARQAAWVEFVETADWAPESLAFDNPQRRAFYQEAGAAAREAIDQYLQGKEWRGDGDVSAEDMRRMREYLRETLEERVIDEDGAIFFAPLHDAADGARTKGQTEVDRYAVQDALRDQIGDRQAEFGLWIERQVMGLFGPPFLRIGRKKAPFTLDNVVAAMSGRVKNQQDHFTFGEGKARAASAKKFRNLEEMRRAAKRSLRSPEESAAAQEATKAAAEEWRTSVSPYYKYVRDTAGDTRASFGATWESFDAAMRALSRVMSGAKTEANMEAQLRREDFVDLPPHIVEDGLALARQMLEAPVPYFEAKPQRAVGLSEFAGAVIPKTAPQQVRDILTEAGVPFQEYDNTDRTAQAKAAAAYVQELGALFQGEQRGSIRYKGFDAGVFGSATIRLTQASDLSTFLHEFGHLGHLVLESIAADEQAPAEFKAMWDATLGWWGLDQAQWSALSEEARVPYFEQWARTFEAYLMEGRAPSLSLREAFAAFKQWLIQIYRSLLRLDHNLTPEIRGVFDRLLATDAEIAEARAAMGSDFTLAREAFKSDAEFEAYTQAIAEARDAQEAELRARAMDAYARKSKRWWRAERERLRDGATRAVDSDPARRAEHWLAAQDWKALPSTDLSEEGEMGYVAPANALEEMPEGLPPMRLSAEALARDWPEASLPVSINPRVDAETVLAEAMRLKAQDKGRGAFKAKRLWRFIKDNGGVRDPDGAIRAAIGGARKRPGVINNESGKTPQELMTLAIEAGYFGDGAARELKQIRAYHGSPHDFDRFDVSRIGTGEGAQAYGHGLYFAEREGVARSYREALAPLRTRALHRDYSLDGKPLSGLPLRYADRATEEITQILQERGFSQEIARSLAFAMGRDDMPGVGRDSLLRSVKQIIAAGRTDLIPSHLERDVLKAARRFESHPQDETGRLYEVSLPDGPYLDWDRPLSEQAAEVREAMARMAETLGFDLRSEMTGEQLKSATLEVVRRNRNEAGNFSLDLHRATSAALREAGIIGIRYLDQGSRSSGEGTRNYVIFSDADVEIIAKDGKPVSRQERAEVLAEHEPGRQGGGEARYETDNVVVTIKPREDGLREIEWDLVDGTESFAPSVLARAEQEGITAALNALRQDAAANPQASYYFEPAGRGLARRYLRIAEEQAGEAGFALERQGDGYILRRVSGFELFQSAQQGDLFPGSEPGPLIVYHGTLGEFTPESIVDFSHFGTRKAARERLDALVDPQFRDEASARVMPYEIVGRRVSIGAEPDGLWEHVTQVADGLLRHGHITKAEHAWAVEPAAEGRTRFEGRDADEVVQERIAELAARHDIGAIGYQNAVEDAGSTSYIIPNVRANVRVVQPGFELFQSDKQPSLEEFMAALIADLTNERSVYSERDGGALSSAQEMDDARAWFDAHEIDLSKDKESIRAQIVSALEADRTDENQWHPDDVAPWFGFSSGDELIQALSALKPRAQAIEERIEAMLEAEHGDAGSRERIEAEARLAAHAEAQARRIELELSALQQATGGRKTPVSNAAKAYAQRQIEAMTIRQVRGYDSFLAGERRAARNAMEAAEKGDAHEAALWKQRQLISFWLYRFARDAAAEMDKFQNYARKFERDTIRAKIHPPLMDQIDQALEGIDLRRAPPISATRRASFNDWFRSMQEEGLEHMVVADPQFLDAVRQRPFNALTLEEARAIRDAVRNFEHIGRRWREVLAARDQRLLDEAVGEMVAHMSGIKPLAIENLDNQSPDLLERIDDKRQHGHAINSRQEFVFYAMDGHRYGGPMQRRLMQPIRDARGREEMRLEEAQAAIKGLFEVYTPQERADMWTRRRFYPQVWNKRAGRMGMNFTKQEVLAIALNVGNDYNAKAMLQGADWSADQVQALLDSALDARDWQFVQSVWDYIDSFWPEIEALYRNMAGVVPPKVAARPFVNAHGEWRGGYYPIKYDWGKDQRAQEEAEHGRIQEAFGQFRLSTQTPNGFTKARQGSGGRPVMLDLSVFTDHVNAVVHDLEFRIPVIDAWRTIKHPAFRDAFVRAAGQRQYDRLKPWLQFIATERMAPENVITGVIRHLRQNTPIALMGYAVSTIVQQPAGILGTMHKLGVGRVTTRIAETFAQPWTWVDRARFINSRSTFMRNRTRFSQREIREMTASVNARAHIDAVNLLLSGNVRQKAEGLAQIKRIIGKNAFFPMAYVDKWVSSIPWMIAYEDAMAGRVENVPGGNEKEAVDYADHIISTTFGSGRPEDMSEIMRSTELGKLLTPAFSYFATQYNQLWNDGVPGMMRGRISPLEVVTFVALALVVQQLVSDWARGAWEPDDDESEEDRNRRLASGLTSVAFAGIPVIRDIARGVSDMAWTGRRPRGDTVPAFGAITSTTAGVGGTIEAIGEGRTIDRATARALTMSSGYWFGLPSRQMWTTGSYISDVATGEEDAPWDSDEPLDAWSEALLRDTR